MKPSTISLKSNSSIHEKTFEKIANPTYFYQLKKQNKV